MPLTGQEKTARYRARLRGEVVPEMKRGPAPGYKQSPELIEKRKRCGDEHHGWKGDAAKRRSGWTRARRRFAAGLCAECGAPALDRHHVDGNTLNNDPANVVLLCRKCHMATRG